ncbi:hypothetical protein [Paenibacillus alba]|uniref:Uncharacterized protein n=1 Tax=Paenibacillus alba TaxID=1197127 RepID=A0ABU6G1R6_9BACL|nr:hypothetical protein [Paenibacillus alba]MEC0227925.1 hypothetical protein [Paenibacillus alba]
MLSVGHFLQRLRSANLFEAFQQEWTVLREKGRVADDYQYTEQFLNNIHEMLNFLEKDIPDEVRFKVLKKIILVAAQETISDRNNLLPGQYIKIAKSMSSAEVNVLFTAYRMIKENLVNTTQNGANEWLQTVAHHSGLDFPELVEIHENQLIDKKLLIDRTHQDRSGVRLGNYNRLTNLGFSFCEYVSKYDEVIDEN